MKPDKAVILCVDDEVVILNSVKKQLKKAFGDTYSYEIAESADEALEIIEELNDEKCPSKISRHHQNHAHWASLRGSH